QNKSYVGLITCNRCNTSVHPYIIVDRQIIIAVRGYKTVLLSEHAVEKTMTQRSMIIIKFYKKICRVCTVNPLRSILNCIIFCLACNRVAEYDSADGHTAKQTDIVFFHRADPVGSSVLIHLKTEIIKNISGILKSQMPVNIPVKMIAGCIFHT